MASRCRSSVANHSASSVSQARVRPFSHVRSWGLLPSTAVKHGSVKFAGQDILGFSAKQMRHLWGAEMSMVFQNPLNSLNPLMKIGKQITEPLKLHLGDG